MSRRPKTSLATRVRSELVTKVREEVLHLLHQDKKVADTLLAKVEDTRKLRKELMAVKKLARERSKAVSLRIPQLKDCKKHFNKEKGKGLDTMVFITEGVSAAGSIVSCRDVNSQAIFTLKGKPLNVWDLKRDAVYKNDEMYNLMRSLGIENSIHDLRYEKVILATDADVDGLHIRNLMITYFFKFFDQLIHDTSTFWRPHSFACAIARKPFIAIESGTREPFKHSQRGLKSTLRLEKYHHRIQTFHWAGHAYSSCGACLPEEANHIFTFYMGKNTPQRRNYIMNTWWFQSKTKLYLP